MALVALGGVIGKDLLHRCIEFSRPAAFLQVSFFFFSSQFALSVLLFVSSDDSSRMVLSAAGLL